MTSFENMLLLWATKVLKTAVEKNTCCFTHQVLKAEEKAAVECFQKPVGLKGMS